MRARCCRASQSVIVVPGYGMAVSQAQHAVRDLAARSSAGASRCGTPSTPWRGACRVT